MKDNVVCAFILALVTLAACLGFVAVGNNVAAMASVPLGVSLIKLFLGSK